MIDTRKEIISTMIGAQNNELNKLVEMFPTQELNLVSWFDKIVKSLSYRVNKTALVLRGERHQCRKFFDLISFEDYHVRCNINKLGIYDMYTNLVILTELESYSDMKILMRRCMLEDFVIIERQDQYPCTDKRLASYVVIENKEEFPVPQKKSFIILDLDKSNFNEKKIDKNKLWIDIYNQIK